MASTNKTTNYELSQFIETDKPAWLTDYNGDMRTIDSTMKAISDVASGASGSISELADRMSTAEGNISTNTNDIDALEARADALEAGQTSDDSRLDALEAEQILQNTAIESNTRLGYNLARPYDSASTYSVGDYVLFQDTLYKCTTAISTGEAFDPNKWLAIKATDEIAAGGIFYNSVFTGQYDNNDPNLFQLQGANSALIYKPLNNNAAPTTFSITQLTKSNHEQIYFYYNDKYAVMITRATLTIPTITLGSSIPYYTQANIYLKLNPNYTRYSELCNWLKDWGINCRVGTILVSQFGKYMQSTINTNGELSTIATTNNIIMATTNGDVSYSTIDIAGIDILKKRAT